MENDEKLGNSKRTALAQLFQYSEWLSEIAKIYDPLGLLAPVTVANKILMQQLWSEKINWDDVIPENIAIKWRKINDEMQIISKLRINRWIQFRPGPRLELHGFSDASFDAYGCCIYAKIFDGDKIHTTLLAAKTKVAPLKKVTPPKLELCGAYLLALLMKRVKEALRDDIAAIKCYSDSKITLAWIQSSASKWKMFVSQRVQKIQKIVKPEDWKSGANQIESS